MVVEIGLGGHDMEFLGQDSRHQFLGGRLAVGAGDTHDRNVELHAVVSGQLLQHGQRILHHDAFAALVVRAFQQEAVDDGILGAGFQGVFRKVVAIEFLSLEREKHHTFLDLTAVRRDPRTLFIEFVQLFYCDHIGCYFFPVDPKPPLPRWLSSSTSTGSHSTVSCRATTIWAIRSPASMMKGSFDRFTRITLISPR